MMTSCGFNIMFSSDREWMEKGGMVGSRTSCGVLYQRSRIGGMFAFYGCNYNIDLYKTMMGFHSVLYKKWDALIYFNL